MQQQAAPEAEDEDEDGATRRRFAELMRRFWRHPGRARPTNPGDFPVTTATLAIVTTALAALGTAGATLAGTGFVPGVWETKTTWADGRTETSRHCAKPADVANDTLQARLGAMTQDPSCKFTQRSVGAGKFAIAASCSNDGMTSTYKQTGTYGPSSMTMNMDMTMATGPGQKPVSMKFTAASRRVAATCPAGMAEE